MKTAIIGMGGIGKVHVEVLRELGYSLSAVCDINEEKLLPYHGSAQYTDYIRLFEQEKPDVVHICTPHYLHAEMVIAALERGINVLCEKPLCIRSEDIPRILEAEARSDAQLGVCLQNRYNSVNAYMKEYLKGKKVTGAIGTVAWHRDAEYYASGDWRGKWNTEGGGVLINQALHTLDLLEWFVGEPQYVTASISNLTLKERIEVEDSALLLCSGGAEFSFFATNGSGVEFPVEITLRTEGEHIKLLPDAVVINGQTKNFREDGRFLGKCCYGTGHERLIGDFYDCIRSGRRFAIDGAEGAKVVKLILSAYESGGKKIPV